MNKWLSVLLTLFLGSICYAGDAVSELNGKAGISAGNMDGDAGRNLSGSVAVPLGTNFGFQADGFYTDVSDRDFYGIGAHLFWRDSEKGLLGLTAGGIRENNILDSWAGGFEGEYYLNDFTIFAQAGMMNINYAVGPLPFIETDETGCYATAGAGFYPIDNLYLSCSYTHALDNGLVQEEIEWQTPMDGLSLFANLAQGENDYDHALAGIRYYFGKQKSLKLRHREDDPPNILSSMMDHIGTYGAEFNQQAGKFLAENNISASGGGGYGCVTLVQNNTWDPSLINSTDMGGTFLTPINWQDFLNSINDFPSLVVIGD
jgi:hypothetical protein